MKNHDPHIEFLLELFMQGKTSLEQEQELSKFFANSTSVPEDWEAYRDMFAFFDAGMPIEEEKPQRHIARPLWTLVATAAIAAIAIMVAPHLRHSHSTEQISTPQPITADNNNILVKDTEVGGQGSGIGYWWKVESEKWNEVRGSRIGGRESERGLFTSYFLLHTLATLDPRFSREALTTHLIAKQERKSIKEKPHTTRHTSLDSIEIEREQGEVEQTQQELMADKFIIEQERQEVLNEQYNSRAQAYKAQLAVQNENPQFIQVVFK